jgi:soluble lytic murein transglycosylase-like protein
MLEPVLTHLQRAVYDSLYETLVSLVNTSSQTESGLNNVHPSSFDDFITQAAEKYELDPALVKAVVHAESNFTPSAVSKAGAKGLMQLMDATAQRFGVTDSFDPIQNIEGGAKYLRILLDRYDGNETLALAAYNAGEGSVDRYNGIPPYAETQSYVPKVLSLRNRYRQYDWSA